VLIRADDFGPGNVPAKNRILPEREGSASFFFGAKFGDTTGLNITLPGDTGRYLDIPISADLEAGKPSKRASSYRDIPVEVSTE
jgi:hypothetical protein